MKKAALIFLNISVILSSAFSQTTKSRIRLNTDENIIYELCYTNEGGALAVADGVNIRLFSTHSYELIAEFSEGHTGTILSLDISSDSTLMVSGGSDSTIVVWDLLTGNIRNKLKYHDGVVTSVKLSSDSHFILSGGSDKRVILYDMPNDSTSASYHGHKEDVTSVAFHPDGIRYLSAGGDGFIYIYSINNKKPVNTLIEHPGWIRNVIFNAIGDRMISCGDELGLIQWNISESSGYKTLKRSLPINGWLLTSDYHMDNQSFVVGSLNGSVLITGKFGTFQTKLKRPIHSVRFNPGSKLYVELAIATRGAGVYIIPSGEMVQK